jgi:hypothetical protein
MRNCVTIQVHPSRLDQFNAEAVYEFLKQSDADVQLDEAPPDEDYINFNCWTDGQVLPIWQHVQRLLSEMPALQAATTVCCTGRHGWDDYLLLHGASEGETLDVLEG